MDERILELLYKSLDGELTPEEMSDLEAALAISSELRKEREDLLAVRGLVKAGAAESFGPFFARRVMRAIRSARDEEVSGARFFASLEYAFRRVVLVAAAIAVFLLIYNLNQGGSMSLAAAFGTPEASIEEILAAPVEETLEELL
jgi:anti-sigma factor RsiW